MFYVYILKSERDSKFYIGYSNNLQKRVKEHNAKLVRSTKSRTPFRVVYYEAYAAKGDATKREHNLKLRAKALRQLLIRAKASLKA